MGRKIGPPADAKGRMTLRMEARTHALLKDVSLRLGIDVTGLVNMMIAESLPRYLEKAAGVKEAYEQAKAAWEASVAADRPALQ